MDPAALRPLGVGEVLDAAIRVYRQKFLTMVKAVAIVVVPVQVLNVLVRLSLPTGTTTTTTSFNGSTTTQVNGGDAATVVAGVLVLFVVGVVSATLAQAACFKTVGDTYLGTESDWRGSLRFGFSRFWSLLWLLVLHGVLLLVAFAACIIPGVWLYAAWSVAIPVLLIEHTGGFRALTRSYDLVKGRWWPTAGSLLLANILASFVAAVFGVLVVPALVAGGGRATTTVAVVSGITSAIGSVLTTPFVAAVVTVIYFDLRVRKEGFDLQLMAWRMGVAPPAGGFVPTGMPWTPQTGWQGWGQGSGTWGGSPGPAPTPGSAWSAGWTPPAAPYQPSPAYEPPPPPAYQPPPYYPPPPGWTPPPAPPPPPPPPAPAPSGHPPPPPGWDPPGDEERHE